MTPVAIVVMLGLIVIQLALIVWQLGAIAEAIQ
jgi:hypothetical protein